MHKLILLALVLQCGLLSAQNWALINPDFKYNYSNDGTDTISNQIFVTHVDTLGVDSFRYELNTIGERSLAYPDTCNLRINIPQFLLRECRLGENKWSFMGTDSLNLRPKAALNEQWIFDPINGTIGTITGISAQTIFGTMDSVRVMTTALNDTVQWSKNRGILRWHLHNGPGYALMGIQGPGVGRLVPSLEEFFPFQPGDVVQFRSSYMQYPQTLYDYERFHIQARIEQPGHLEFTGISYKKHIDMNGYDSYSTNLSRTWILDSATTGSIHPVYSAPMQIVHISGGGQFPIFMIADHTVDASGNYVIWSGHSGNGSLFYWPHIVPGDCQTAPAQWPSVGYYYLDTRLGLRNFNIGFGPGSSSFKTVGAVISGDTIGSVYSDDFFHLVGIEETNLGPSKIYPDPATDHIIVPLATPGSPCTVLDAQGRTVINRSLTTDRRINVENLRAGIYLLLVNGRSPRRFSVAR